MLRAISGLFIFNFYLLASTMLYEVLDFGSFSKKKLFSILVILSMSSGASYLKNLMLLHNPKITVDLSRLSIVSSMWRLVDWLQFLMYAFMYSRMLCRYLYYYSYFSPSNTLFVLFISSNPLLLYCSASLCHWKIRMILFIYWNLWLST
jgi:hypothetical protein